MIITQVKCDICNSEIKTSQYIGELGNTLGLQDDTCVINIELIKRPNEWQEICNKCVLNLITNLIDPPQQAVLREGRTDGNSESI